MKRLPPLLLITDRKQACRPLPEVIEAAFGGGCRFLSLREKDLPADERVALLEAILPLARRYGATLLVHGDLEAAARCHGIHLGAGGDLAEARAKLGEGAWVGLSCHTVEEVRAAAASGADHVTLGPVAPTPSKPGYGPTLGMEALRESARAGVPVLALGGVDENNAGALRQAGIAGIAVMGGVMRSEDPERAVRRLIEAWNAG